MEFHIDASTGTLVSKGSLVRLYVRGGEGKMSNCVCCSHFNTTPDM